MGTHRVQGAKPCHLTGRCAVRHNLLPLSAFELQFARDKDKKNQAPMSELAAKVKNYKKQIEEAEEIAALNPAKSCKAQQGLVEVEERARVSQLH